MNPLMHQQVVGGAVFCWSVEDGSRNQVERRLVSVDLAVNITK